MTILPLDESTLYIFLRFIIYNFLIFYYLHFFAPSNICIFRDINNINIKLEIWLTSLTNLNHNITIKILLL